MLTVVIMDLDLPNAKASIEKALVQQAYRLFPTNAGAAKALNINEAELHFLSLKHQVQRESHHAKHPTDAGIGGSVVASPGDEERMRVRELDWRTNQSVVPLVVGN